MRNYGPTSILIDLGVKMGATEGVVLGVVLLDMGGVVISERGRGDKDDDKSEVSSTGGVEGIDEEGDLVVAGVNVRGWENVVTSIPGADVDVKHHEFLLPFLFF